ncbi:glycoside hydrolase family 16 protein [Aeromicrobium endophyticum]|uniref:Glycoside hydrolase family 16 protein n=1 Tax=Aeromicrobium endophyticum TaxID=2292704 RepID=A0A371PA88_9ACTN|nr:glycoside hydrolase family 16 protein [Aeromicrobium endophyticum]REK72863.1 glycoside hydrolase family 16 protein [Aeromicrobium endophyticum]
MHRTEEVRPFSDASGRREATSWCGPLLRLVAVSVVATALIVGPDTLSTPVDAAPSPVTIRTIPAKVVAPGAAAVVRPMFTKRSGVSVRKTSIDVRRGASWVGRGMRSAHLTAGSYRVTTKVTYRDRGTSRQRTARRTQVVRVTTAAASSGAPVSVPTPAPVVSPTPDVTPSLARTSTACDDTQLVKPDGTPWTCTFSDEFGGTRLDRTKWLPQTTAASGYQIGADCYVDDPDNISVGGGSLALTVRKEAEPVACPGARKGDETVDYTAGSVSTWGLFTQARGRFEFRAAFPAMKKALDDGVAGPHSALWLFPAEAASTFPFSGEIDVLERYPQWPDHGVPYIHYQPDASDQSVTNACRITDPSQFHTYTLEWTPTTLSIAYDGVTCVSHVIKKLDPAYGPAPFDRAFMLVLTQGLEAGAATSATPTTGTTKVDYVRVWK